ncbi:MAG: cytochrome c oxidase subunit 3 [Gammaproteobacteria bacterium]|nr:cytochrome c oxidase subunit 3 [Gammaproteobacteria bacterium]
MSDHASGAHWHSEPHPVLVGFGAGFFLPWAFMFQYVYHQGLFAIIALTLAVLMLLVGGIGWVNATIGVVKDEGWSPSAMLMFIGTEALTVGGMLAAYWTMRASAPVWPPEGTPEVYAPIFATLFVLLSSFTVAFARKKQQQDDVSGFMMMTVATIVIWVGFGVLTMMSWGDLMAQGFNINTNAYATAVYGMTGIHFAHLVFGLFIMLLAIPPALKGHLSDSYARAMSMYVHFVNVLSVWVLLLVFLW